MKLKPFVDRTVSLFTSFRRMKAALAVVGKEVLNRVGAAPQLPSDKMVVPSFVKATVFPVPAVICGALVGERPNFNLLGNFGIVSPQRPNPIIYISSARSHFTNQGIRENGAFSVNIPSRSIMARADYLGVASGHTVDKSGTMTVFYGKRNDVPCVAEAPLNYVCRVLQHFDFNEMEMFIAEIVETYITRTFMNSNHIDIESMEPLLYTADGAYRIAGAPVGHAYSAYKEYKSIIS
jgi:flavin reductase (DIM6/NTAB) family NADH-FMN oxidoreductase RutF